MTTFWHRRICEAIILAASITLAIYLWAFLSGLKSPQPTELISDTAAAFAALTIVVALGSYFLSTKIKKFTTETALLAYIVLCVTVAMVILETDGAASPFIALWMFVSVLAGIFGARTLIPLFIAVNLYLVVEITRTELSKETIIAIVLGGELPLVLSYLLWNSKAKGENNKERAYYDLANELNQVSNKAEVVINAIGEGVIAVDNKGIIELMNPAAGRIIGWGKQDAIGLGYKSVLHLLDRKEQDLTISNDPIYDVINTNQTKTRNDLSLMTTSGKKLNVSVVVSPIGKLGSGVIVVFHDMTKEQQEEREQAEFISTASHEMRTPVASIEGYLGLALNPATAKIDDKARDFITKAHESAQHLGRLFQDLLDVSKAEDGRLQNNEKVVDVVAYTQTIIEGFKPKADAKNLRIFFKPETTSSSLTGGDHTLSPVFYSYVDMDHLREVLSNLIENAIKYTPQGEVVIDIVSDDTHTIVSVTDSGIGIPAEDIPHLFQKFYRVDNTDTREIGGTGLGLYLCRRLAESMNGRLWVESEYKKGSTFYLEIPRISHEEATKLIEQAGAAAKQHDVFSTPSRSFADANSAGSSLVDEGSAGGAELPPVILHAKDVHLATANPAPEQGAQAVSGMPSQPEESAPPVAAPKVAPVDSVTPAAATPAPPPATAPATASPASPATPAPAAPTPPPSPTPTTTAPAPSPTPATPPKPAPPPAPPPATPIALQPSPTPAPPPTPTPPPPTQPLATTQPIVIPHTKT